MAYYQNANSLIQLSDPRFDKTFRADETVDFAGIYKCVGCNREIAVDYRFPSEEQHPHSESEGEVLWKLIVWVQ